MVKGQSGRTAYIVTGRDIPFSNRWHRVCRQYRGCRIPATYKRIETGFELLPMVRGQYVLVSLTPRISTYAEDVIRFAEAVTQVRIPLGRWVDIGQMTGKENTALGAVMDRGAGKREEALSIRLMIEPDRQEP
jgi:hypothetical protein